jgi:hypothetical protein
MLSTIQGTINTNFDNLRRDINLIFYQNNINDLRSVVSSLALPAVSSFNSTNVHSTPVINSTIVSSNLYQTINLAPINIEDLSQVCDISGNCAFKRICSKSCICISTNQAPNEVCDISGNCLMSAFRT